MKKRSFKNRKVLLLFHIVVLGILGLVAFKYMKEIMALKDQIVSRIRYEIEETNEDFSDDEPIAHTDGAWYENVSLIYHGGGAIEGRSHSNSKEALEQTLNMGQRYIEIDFLYTKDRYLVCAHDWNDLYDNEASVLTLDEFQKYKIYGKYTSLTAKQLIDYMEMYEDLYIIVDTKEENHQRVIEDLVKMSAHDSNVTDRFIIQLYQDGMKEQCQKLYPFKDENFLFTTYKYGTEYTNKLMKTCYEEDIAVITIPYGAWNDETIEMFVEKGFVIYEHTVNRVNRAKNSLEKGVSGFYTDYLTEDELRD